MLHTLKILTLLILFLPAALPAAQADFAHEIVPLLRKHCTECHTGDKKKGGFSLNSRADLLRGSEHGAVVKPGDSSKNKLLEVVVSTDDEIRMPPPDASTDHLTAPEIELLKRWIDGGLKWEDGFAFKKSSYDPPLKPRNPDLPAVLEGRANPIDRIIDAALAARKAPRPARLDDGAFLRRATLDLTGLLPEPEALDAFLHDPVPDKRAKKIRALLADDTAYAEHWLSFWNDLLRNDYAGTGYIDGGRKQITAWLYAALLQNKPYDQFARELLAPNADSEGFSHGIKWRGSVSAAQLVPVQFSQSVAQTFLGINLKCASCHDSFIDRWKLDEAYGLAAVYSAEPLQVHRCDKPVGRTAKAAWLFPELGQIDPAKPPAERLKQLAALMTHPDNGRFTRTIVNRLWQRTMGRGIVDPVDAMQTPPWNADLLDFLAADFAANHYDLKHTLELICSSEAYQSASEIITPGVDDHGYVYAGPRTKRLTAEEFTDAVWQLTRTAPLKFDAPIKRGKSDAQPADTAGITLSAQWIWSSDGAKPPAAGESISLRKIIDLPAVPESAVAVVTCDNEFTLYINGKKEAESIDWEHPVAVNLDNLFKKGKNTVVLLAKNGGTAPNPAGLFFEARLKMKDGKEAHITSDATWEWTPDKPNAKGAFAPGMHAFKPAVPVAQQATWAAVNELLKEGLAQSAGSGRMVRAALLKSDLLMRTLGRPNREQIVTSRPTELNTLDAMDLINGPLLNARLEQGANHILNRQWNSSDELLKWLYAYALSRPPSDKELKLAGAALGPNPSTQSVQDVLWAIVMLPEFQLVR